MLCSKLKKYERSIFVSFETNIMILFFN